MISRQASPEQTASPTFDFQPNSLQSTLFRSFWLAGFESACHINRAGQRVDMIATTQHELHADEDYALIAHRGIRAARDAVRWHRVDRGGRYDFSSLAAQLRAADRHGVDVIWTLCHYGWPDDLDIFKPAFVDRFARYAAAAAQYIKDHSAIRPFFTPINEISYFAFAVGDVGHIYPFATGRASELKAQLVRASIAAMETIWSVSPEARFVIVDPLIHVVTPHDRPDLARQAQAQHEGQFEAWDMLAGRRRPELGGSERYLDIAGLNYYYNNQWEFPGNRLVWEASPRDPRWVPLHRLLADFYARYERPLFLSETSHVGVGRAQWINEVVSEVALAREQGVPMDGICLYPIIDRPDWDQWDCWHNAGLWDLHPEPNGRLRRVLCEDYAGQLARLGCG